MRQKINQKINDKKEVTKSNTNIQQMPVNKTSIGQHRIIGI